MRNLNEKIKTTLSVTSFQEHASYEENITPYTMDEEIVSMFILGGLILGIAYLFFTTRHRERMKLFELFADSPEHFPKPYFRADALKFGLLGVGIAIGSLVGNLLYENHLLEEEIAYTSMVFLFGGIGLISSYLILRKK